VSPRLRRLLLWDFDRGTLSYDIMCLVLAVLLLVVPASGCDPMVGR
jgi:hypothetical protein